MQTIYTKMIDNILKNKMNKKKTMFNNNILKQYKQYQQYVKR